MTYDFDKIIDRTGTNALKTDALVERFGRTDLLPLWVADMDFATPDFILEAIKRRCEHPIWGYTLPPESYFQSIIDWLARRHSWNVAQSAVGFVPGVVPALAFAINAFTERGDKVMVQPPVYYPFMDVIRNNERELVFNPLKLESGQLAVDFEDFERKVKSGVKVFVLCNPHNPGGRAWECEVLARIAEICAAHKVLVVSDEIHCDLMLNGRRHIPFATVSDEARENSLTLMAPSKTFNTAGINSAFFVAENRDVRCRYQAFLHNQECAPAGIAAYVATQAAYERGDEWLSQLLAYIEGNMQFVEEFLQKHIPSIQVIVPQATYLMWLDFRETGLSQQEIKDLLIQKAGMALNDGTSFGPGGEGFMRLNVACPRSVLQEAMKRLKEVWI